MCVGVVGRNIGERVLIPLCQGGLNGKEFACNSGDPSFNPWVRKEDFLENGMAYPLQYSCLENPMDRGAWRATLHGVAELDMTEQLTLSPDHYHTYNKLTKFLILFSVQSVFKLPQITFHLSKSGL